MTEQQWLRSTDPNKMLQALQPQSKNRQQPKLTSHYSPRKQRLFVCACCRRLWDLLTDRRSRQAVETAEEFADGLVAEKALVRADGAARRAEAKLLRELTYPGNHGELLWRSRDADDYKRAALFAAKAAGCAAGRSDLSARSAVDWIVKACGELALIPTEGRPVTTRRRAQKDAGTQLANLLRCVYGNPFRPVAFDPAWRTPNVTAVAQTIFDERRFADMPILADALEEAGCTSEEILSHCRNGGEHVRGCWVVDLALAKE